MSIPTVTLTDANGRSVNFLATVQNNIPYIELVRSYKEAFRADENSSTRLCLCRWDDRLSFLLDMLGYATYAPGVSVGGLTTNLSRTPPEQHPYWDFMYVDGVELVAGMGVPTQDMSDIAKMLTTSPDYTNAAALTPPSAAMYDPDTNSIRYAAAAYAVHYSAPGFTVAGDADLDSTQSQGELGRFVIRAPQFNADSYQAPGHGWKFVSDNQLIQTQQNIIFPTIMLQYQWLYLPQINYTNLQGAIGKINSNDPWDLYWAKDTLLCTGAEPRQVRLPNGTLGWNVTFSFQYRPQTWNKFWRTSVGGTGAPGFDAVVSTDVSATPPYAETDFNVLFQL